MPRKTPEQKIKELEVAQARIRAKMKDEKAKLQKQKRREDTRRKIIVGSVILAHMEHDENFKHVIETVLKNRTIRDDDRMLLGLEPLNKKE